MRWQRGHQSPDVEVRRGGAVSGLGSLVSLLPLLGRKGGIILLLAVAALYIGNRYLCDGSTGVVGDGREAVEDVKNDEAIAFVSFVLDDAQNTWEAIARHNDGASYRRAKMVVFRGSTGTACGFGSSAMGPFYCPSDETVYIDLSFYDELRDRFGAPGDFAQAYVIAHEVGHHVQHQLGLLDGGGSSGPSSQSVRQELQADCLAGIWAHSTSERKLLERGDIEEALRAASSIGDDAIQKQSGGAVRPESWTHGSSEQRIRWFRRGFDSGRLDACDTSHGSL